MINLLSDTVTKPSPAMLQAMMEAEVGDDVFGEDPTVNKLQEKVAAMFSKEAALFCPSGTMTNQLAIKINTQPLDEMICDHYSHVYQSENGGYAFHSGIAVNLVVGTNGKITAHQIEQAIKPDFDWLPKSSLVVIENSCNKGGGSFYTLDEIKPISILCQNKGLKIHLDGARIFNVLVETGETTEQVGPYFDTISICLSKGLGAPVGSLLIGSAEDIKKARRFRKAFGGGMRQVGYLAAAGIYALDNNIAQCKLDNEKAIRVGRILQYVPFVKEVKDVRTNIILFEHKAEFQTNEILNLLHEKGIHAAGFGPNIIRFVFHLDVSNEDVDKVVEVLENWPVHTSNRIQI